MAKKKKNWNLHPGVKGILIINEELFFNLIFIFCLDLGFKYFQFLDGQNTILLIVIRGSDGSYGTKG